MDDRSFSGTSIITLVVISSIPACSASWDHT
jgi:hypothetical protein